MIANYQKQWNFLKNKFETGQMAHAYLFSGKDLELIKNFAKSFAKSLNCLYYKSHGRGICGVDEKEEICQNCMMIEKGIFSDLMIVKSEDSESSLKNKKDMMEITIGQIRNAAIFLGYTAYYEGYKVLIIEDSERMTFEAQNCFLKTLEEPKGETIIFLVSSKPDLLLPTILSRCQEIRFFHCGQYDILKSEEVILENLRKIMDSELAERFQYVKNANLEGKNFNEILMVMRKHFRNLLLSKINEEANSARSNYSIKNLKNIIELIENINRQADITNINSKLALEMLLMEISL